METIKSKEYKIAYLINDRKLKELETIINEFTNEIKYKIKCTDGSEIKFESIENLLEFPNRKNRQYKEIEIYTPYGSSEQIIVTLSSSAFSPMRYVIRGNENTVEYYSNKIEGFLQSLSRWYSIIGVNNTVSLLLVMIISGLIMFATITAININDNFIIIYFFLIFPMLFLLDKSRLYIFPVASFELKDGIERTKLKDSLRNLVLVGIVLSAIVGFFVNQIPSIGFK